MRTTPLTIRAALAVATVGGVALGLTAPAAAQVADPYAGPIAAPRATVLHVPVAEATPGEPVQIVAVIDGAWAEPTLIARYRRRGGAWQDAAFEQSSAGGWFATIPAQAIAAPGAEYYIVGQNADGEIAHFASAAAPQPIRLEPTLTDRLEKLDDDRQLGRRESVSFDVDGHNFGNRYGNRDDFARAELRWTHRVSRTLHSIGFGFGSIWGHTPDRDGRGALDQLALARYGTADVRVRAHPSLFLDGRVSLGVSDEGFLRGVGGAIIFGKPWRSNIAFGADMLDDLGPTAYVRLQWDTAPPVLMGASIVRTDLPDAQVSSQGLYIKYDLAYKTAGWFTVRGAVSYGSRDGAGKVGGSVGMQADF